MSRRVLAVLASTLVLVACGVGGLEDQGIRPSVCVDDYRICARQTGAVCNIDARNIESVDMRCVEAHLGACWSAWEHCLEVCRAARVITPHVCRDINR